MAPYLLHFSASRLKTSTPSVHMPLTCPCVLQNQCALLIRFGLTLPFRPAMPFPAKRSDMRQYRPSLPDFFWRASRSHFVHPPASSTTHAPTLRTHKRPLEASPSKNSRVPTRHSSPLSLPRLHVPQHASCCLTGSTSSLSPRPPGPFWANFKFFQRCHKSDKCKRGSQTHRRAHTGTTAAGESVLPASYSGSG